MGHWEDGETAGVSESDSKQFILLHLNCHLMRLQSGALSKKKKKARTPLISAREGDVELW